MRQFNQTQKKFAIIAGSMKCGTTILYDYMCENPIVAGYPGKEAHYFSLNYDSIDFSDYLMEFGDNLDNLLCDASPTYFDCSDRWPTFERIKQNIADPVLIVLIRNPVERMLSHFSHLKNVNKIEILQNITANDFFADFKHPQDSKFADYLPDVINFSFYHKKITKLLNTFDEKKCVVLDNSSLSASPIECMKLIYASLGLEFFDSSIYGKRKYMSGTNMSCIDEKLRDELSKLFEDDYRLSLDLCTNLID